MPKPKDLCARCGVNPRRNGHRWCSACWKEYETERVTLFRRRLATKAVEEFRRSLVDAFEGIGGQEMTGYTAAAIVRDHSLSERVSVTEHLQLG